MKSLCMLALTTGLLWAATLQDIRTVYIFPMRHGMDQYLTGRLAQEHIFQVVSDPKAADAVFTDRVGPAFEQSFDQRVLDLKPKSGEEAARPTFFGRGTLFLVTKSKQVIWSAFDPPKDTTPKQMENAARRSVERLKKDVAPKTVIGK